MKNIFTQLHLCAIIVFAIGCSNSNKNGTISGKLNNFNGEYVFLQQITETGDQNLDSSKVDKRGNFTLKNPAGETDYYILRTDSVNIIFLVLKAGESVTVDADAKNLEASYKVKGSKDSDLLRILRSYDKTLSDSLNTLYVEIRNQNPVVADSIGSYLQEYYAMTMEEFAKNFIRQNLNSIVSLSATKFVNQQSELGLLQELQAKLISIYPKNKYVADFTTLIGELNVLPAGSMAPEITLNNFEGKPVSLSSLKGKVVLIDFWASWCAPCRIENPDIVAAYEKLKGKDFEIYGISLDNNIEAWNEAVIRDKIKWIQVSDLLRWESPVVKQYQVQAIPFNILIDREGKIIAKGIKGHDLYDKVSLAINSSK
ncbi:MAG: AhpC/TSA family protein [Bacteroidetes bacterium]|nr:AhpC/TSA family protein [Bacteroidota bacterium]MBK8365556.1 AhpC/TSA family protein [Bacteroidota bacterium]MBK9412259.1 AhpC/TSA family protein [Bacteroidota bacterium]MBP6656820.1 AhpC/TSA family protein [Bacteroidia bacterium]